MRPRRSLCAVARLSRTTPFKNICTSLRKPALLITLSFAAYLRVQATFHTGEHNSNTSRMLMIAEYYLMRVSAKCYQMGKARAAIIVCSNVWCQPSQRVEEESTLDFYGKCR